MVIRVKKVDKNTIHEKRRQVCNNYDIKKKKIKSASLIN